MAAALHPVAAHAGYNIFTDQLTFTRDEILAQIARRFPVSAGAAGLMECVLSHPGLTLRPVANRLEVTADLRITTPLLDQPAAGVIAISTGLWFDKARLSICLARPQADRIELRGLAPQEAAQLQAAGGALAAEVLRDYPLHTFRPEELRVGRRQFSVESITVTDTGLTVQLA